MRLLFLSLFLVSCSQPCPELEARHYELEVCKSQLGSLNAEYIKVCKVLDSLQTK